MDEFASMDATAQAELVRKREVKPIELVEAAIKRIEKVNPELNAVVTPMYDEARAIAAAGPGSGPFAGVPYLLKDLGPAYAGVRLTSGSRFLRDYIPDTDSELVVRLKRAGLITVGKTNTPEFGLLPTTEPALFGACHNPWDTTRTTGGSSGGSAAAVAAGIVPAAHANDGGGSIRIPASCCGVFGLKPTRARVSPSPKALAFVSVNHAVTRSVRDSATILDATQGAAPGDLYWAPPPERPYAQEVGANPGRLRIAFATRPLNGMAVQQDCVDAVRDAAALCADLGHEVVEVSPLVDGDLLDQAWLVLFAGGAVRAIETLPSVIGRPVDGDGLEVGTWGVYEMARKYSGADYVAAIENSYTICRQVAAFLDRYDVWLTPTLAEPPVPLGTFDATPEDPLKARTRARFFSPFTKTGNVTGNPGMSVPLYWNKEGLPIGTHFLGRFGDEATLFRLAAQLEQARPWANRRPPVSA